MRMIESPLRTVRMQKSKLLEIVRRNAEAHTGEVAKAKAAYYLALVGILEKKLTDAKAGKHVSHHVDLPQVEDHSRDYQRALAMLELEVGDTVELDGDGFANLVQDEWSWKESYHMSNERIYTLSAGGSVA